MHEGVEECDDGNDSDEDACTTECKLARCGDGIVQEGEDCDDENTDDDDQCPANCRLPVCGVDIECCSFRLCQNGGKCTDTLKGYQCECPPEYTGKNCELPRLEIIENCVMNALSGSGEAFVGERIWSDGTASAPLMN
nr:MAG: hypothetical protein DIU78_10705 [Pseudomonadota bacterium]